MVLPSGQVPRVIFHTDQGSQGIHSPVVPGCLRPARRHPVEGRPGSALDNAVIESWHSTLEFELRAVEHFATKAVARAKVAAGLRTTTPTGGTRPAR